MKEVGGVVGHTLKDEASSAAAVAIAIGTATATATSTRVVEPRITMDPRIFGGTNKAAMISTLEGLQGLRRRYTTTSDHDSATTNTNRIPHYYFDIIGFNKLWRKRFRAVFKKKINIQKKNNVNNR